MSLTIARNCAIGWPSAAAASSFPTAKTGRNPFPFDAVTYKRRNVVKRTFCRFKDFRRVAMRFDSLDATFIATLCIAAAGAYFLK